MPKWLITLVIILSVSLAAPVLAATRYVDSTAGACTGNYSIANRNCTGSNGNSYATIQAGLNATTGAGDTLYVRTGTYTQTVSLTTWPTAGTSTGRILIAAYGSTETSLGEAVTIACSGISTPYNCLDFNRAAESFITIQGFILDGGGGPNTSTNTNARSVIKAQYPSDPTDVAHDLWIINNEIKNADAGVLNGRPGAHQGWVIRGNYIHHTGTSTKGHALYLKGRDNLAEYNRFENNGQAAIQVWDDGGANTSNNDTILRWNTITTTQLLGTTGPAKIVVGYGTRIQIYGNILWGNGVNSAAISCAYQVVDCRVWNNSISHGGQNAITTGDFTSVTSATIKNNIAMGSTGSAISDPRGIATLGTNLTTNPGLVNPATGNLSLLSTASAAINTGTVNGTYCPTPCSIGAHQPISLASTEIGAVNSTTLVLNLASKFPPVSPATGITGLTSRYNSGSNQTSSCLRQTGSDLQIRCTQSSGASVGQAVDVSYAQTGNLTDCADIGRGTGAVCSGHNQEMFALTNAAVVNNTGGAPTFALAQSRARWRSASYGIAEVVQDTSREWFAAENVDMTVTSPGAITLRVKITCNTSDCTTQGYAVWWASTIDGIYAKISDSCTTDPVCMYTTYTTRAGATTRQLTTDEATFVPGGIRTSQAAIPDVALTQDAETEFETILLIKAGLTVGDTLCFRTRNDASEVMTYTVTPCLTIAPLRVVYR